MLDVATEVASSMSSDQFVQRVAESMTVYVVAGESGLARAPSRFKSGQDVTFLWSERAETEKWASCVAVNPRIKELPLGEVLSLLLPGLAAHGRRVGTDWSDGPDEPELEPLELAASLRDGLVGAFASRAVKTGSVWVVSGTYGPAMMNSKFRPQGSMLPCWSVFDRAEIRVEGPWEEMVVSEIPLELFLGATLPGLAESGAMVCPDNILGVDTLEMAPLELARRLRGAGAGE